MKTLATIEWEDDEGFCESCSTDTTLARRVSKILREAGFQVWDDTLMIPGENWAEKVADALEDSDAMVVLLTSDALRSRNISHEVGYALGKKDFKGRIIPVLVGSGVYTTSENIPWILRKFRAIHVADPNQSDEDLKQIVKALHEASQPALH